ncbi:MAG: hypothetical protein H7318_19090 [Oligoflexus sp.]|nr:hypothetical protein [Oligoflexus sp.]
MKNTLFAWTVACLLANSAFTCQAATLPLKGPERIKIEKLSPDLSAPRFLTFTKEGDMRK